jgi:hypothetical protein
MIDQSLNASSCREQAVIQAGSGTPAVLPHARYFEIACAGHMSPQTHPADICAAIRAHVDHAVAARTSKETFACTKV